MANDEHLRKLKQGVEFWNGWREKNPLVRPELEGAMLNRESLIRANLEGANLIGASLSEASLRQANLRNADLVGAFFEGTNLEGADFESANLRQATFANAYLVSAKLVGSNLRETNFTRANLREVDLASAELYETGFTDVAIADAKGLDRCRHLGPSIVDYRTIVLSPGAPISFWRGCGFPERLIDYLPSMLGEAVEFYSCFVSYSSKDQHFAERLHADLQNAGVRCWFAPHDLPIGKKILDGIDDAIRLRDKVVLVLSKDAIASDWVEDEVTTAFEEERRRNETVLFPIRLDDAVMETGEAWASKLRARNIGDFTKWKEHDAYKATFERVLRDLRAER